MRRTPMFAVAVFILLFCTLALACADPGAKEKAATEGAASSNSPDTSSSQAEADRLVHLEWVERNLSFVPHDFTGTDGSLSGDELERTRARIERAGDPDRAPRPPLGEPFGESGRESGGNTHPH